jgi:hypothetical protein
MARSTKTRRQRRQLAKEAGELTPYQKRDQLLVSMGYISYAHYLRCKLWKGIRAKVLKRAKGTCEVCRVNPPTEVHHRSYIKQVMLGKNLQYLVATCRTCHQEAEFDGGRKVTLSHANSRMNALAKDFGNVTLPGLCMTCRKNPTKPGREFCGRCMRDDLTSEYLSIVS